MRKALVSFTLILASAFFSFSQTFSPSDSRFQVSDHFRTYAVVFDLSKPTLRPDSYPQLDSIAELLSKNPSIKMEVAVHTDSRISQSSSMRLSEARAKSIRDYLVSKGVASDRLVPKGYDDVKPLISDKEIAALKTVEEKEAAHQKNRRVEFKILSL